jgi:hypothetical protein
LGKESETLKGKREILMLILWLWRIEIKKNGSSERDKEGKSSRRFCSLNLFAWKWNFQIQLLVFLDRVF